jgi:uncharacterized protein (DUF2062 family)
MLGFIAGPAVSSSPYLHERWWLVAVLAVVMQIDLIATVISMLDDPTSLPMLLVYRDFPAHIAVCILTAQKAFTGLRHPPPPSLVPELPVKRFLAIWLAVMATMLLAIPVLAAYGFSLSMMIWR